MENFLEILRPAIGQLFGAEISACDKLGGGMAGTIYKLTMDKPPYVLAVKTANNAELLTKECAYIEYIGKLADIKLPRIYHKGAAEGCGYAVMDFFDGKDCADNYTLKAPRKTRLDVAEQIADNIIKLQSVHGEKYGDLLDPVYDDWHDHYHPFLERVIREAEGLLRDGLLNERILETLRKGERYYSKIFDEPISPPTPIHGDYWAKNIIVDRDHRLIGVVDPFNCMWADSEYELFALNAVYGRRLPVLEAFLRKVKVSDKFFLKNSLYYFVSEVYWVRELRHDNIGYLTKLTREFNRQLRKFGVK